MIFEKVIEGYPEGYNLKIGSDDGNGFFYYGTIGDYAENRDIYSERLKNYMTDQKNKAEEKCHKAIDSFCSDVIKAAESITINENYIISLEPIIVRLSKMIYTERNAKERLTKFVPLKDRPVVDFFDCDTAIEPDGCLAVIVKGFEAGKFWDGSEFTGDHLGMGSDNMRYCNGEEEDE